MIADNGWELGSRSSRALELLMAMVSVDRPMSIPEKMLENGLPKAMAHRLFAFLESKGFIAPDIGGKGLVFGHRTWELALGVMALSSVDAFRHSIFTEVSPGNEQFDDVRDAASAPFRHGGTSHLILSLLSEPS